MTKISIVGGGITGLAVAYSVNKPVNVFEASSKLGGILRDLKSNGYSFFSACQYLNGGASWLHRMGLYRGLFEFDHSYGSYTDIFGKKQVSDSFAGPIYDGLELDYGTSESLLGASLANRCDLFPTAISSSLKKWFTHIGIDINITHHSVITGFQASRIYVLGQEAKIAQLKEENIIADNIFGLPRNVIGLPSIKSFLPVSGFNNLFDNFLSYNNNIQFERNSPVDCEILNNSLILKTKRGSFEPSLVIWTADPTKLVSKTFGIRLDANKFSTEVLTGFLDLPVDSPFYIQVYSLESRVMRIYLYNIDGRGCFTVEKAFDDQMACEVVRFCKTVISYFSNKKIKNIMIRKKIIRYFVYTVKDYNALSGLLTQEHVKNLITPDYTSYSRDHKITSVLNRLHKY
jgi:NAD(P)-binding Rossmann-like domain